MDTRRMFLARIAAALAGGSGLLAARSAPVVQRVAEQYPRYLYDPVQKVMTEWTPTGYRTMTDLLGR